MSTPALYRLPRADRDAAAGIYLGAVVTVVSVIGLAIWVATQYAAYRLRFHPALGALHAGPLTPDAAPRHTPSGPR